MSAATSREIILNVYDIEDENGRSGGIMKAVGLGSYHSGVEISNAEWTFSSGAGVFFHKAKEPAVGRGQRLTLKESIVIGVHYGSANEVNGIISKLRDDFTPSSYHVVRRNCNHFSSALCKELVGEDIPTWVNRAANVGSFLYGGAAKKVAESMGGGDKKKAAAVPKAATKKKELTEQQKAALAALKGGGQAASES